MNGKSIHNLLTIAISLLAFLAAVISLYFSYQANCIAKESQYQANRPRVQLAPAELPGGDYFFAVEENGKFHIKIQLVAANNGFSPAVDIAYVKENVKIKIISEDISLKAKTPKDSPSIGPSQKYYRMFSYVVEPVGFTMEIRSKLFNALRNRNFAIELETELEYRDNLSNKKHATYALYQIGKSSVEVKKYEEK